MSCYEPCSLYRRTSRMPEQLYLFTHIEASMPYRANSTQMPVSLMKHSRQSPLSKLRSQAAVTFFVLTCFSLAFASGNFGPVVSSFPVRKPGGARLLKLPNLNSSLRRLLASLTSHAVECVSSRSAGITPGSCLSTGVCE
jgi:hypothetical protein